MVFFSHVACFATPTKDKDFKFRLIIVEGRIHQLTESIINQLVESMVMRLISPLRWGIQAMRLA